MASLVTNAQNAYSKKDNSTFSNAASVRCLSVHLEWRLDFVNSQIHGSATHAMEILVAGTESALFDSRVLTIKGVEIDGKATSFTVSDENAALGSCITVSIPENLRAQGSKFQICFQYSTSKEAPAIQWLDKEATAGGQHPYAFTQSQAIHARSLFPCQDSPGAKLSYTANVTAPSWCTVLMSALSQGTVPGAVGTDEVVHKWSQPVNTSTYLIALAAGRLDSRDISSRVRVWSEPEVIEKVAYEFSETEEFLTAAEGLTCPYQWGRYDVLCLPPSFPYGGMENPCLTFATPTLLAGDRSLADVIAHEIAHSWTGNLVTNATWEHFWLNEGWTVWLERKIMSRVKGLEFLKLSAQGGWGHLKDSIEAMKSGPFTALVWPLQGEDPDDAFSSVPYEKGFNLLWKLENIVSTPKFELFASDYIQHFMPGVVTSGEFRDYFVNYFRMETTEIREQIAALDWDMLFYSTGIPIDVPDFSNSLSRDAMALANEWKQGTGCGTGATQFANWNTKQRCIFLEELNDTEGGLSAEMIALLDSTFNLTAIENSEVKFSWQTLCLDSGVDFILPHVVNFITSQGRMKFVRPHYRALRDSSLPQGKQLAIDTFNTHKMKYHPICRKMVASDLGVTL